LRECDLKLVVIISLFFGSCAVFYKTALALEDPKNMSSQEYKEKMASKIRIDSSKYIDVYFVNDDSMNRVQSFNSSLINLFLFYDIDGGFFKPISGLNECNIDNMVKVSQNPSQYLIRADTNNIKKNIDYKVFRSLNDVLKNTKSITNNYDQEKKKKTIVFFWSFFGNKDQDVKKISTIISNHFNADSFQIVRLNCDLVDSKYKKFKAKTKQNGQIGSVEIDFIPSQD